MKTHIPKFETDNSLKLSVFWLNKNKYLRDGNMDSITWSQGGQEVLTVAYCVILRDGQTDFFIVDPYTRKGFQINLKSTSCNYGGKRWWFLCPVKNCSKLIGVLYKTPDLGFFACRKCLNLTYKSSKLSGRHKKIGKYLLIPELKTIEAGFKKRFYRDDLTKRYKTFLKKREQTFSAMEGHIKWAKDFVSEYKRKKGLPASRYRDVRV